MDEISDSYKKSITRSTVEGLRGVLGQIDRERFPNRYKFVLDEIENRKLNAPSLDTVTTKASIKKRLLFISFGLLIFLAYVLILFQTSKLNANEIEVLRKYLETSSELTSQVESYQVLPDQPKFENLSVSLFGKPPEGTLRFKVRFNEFEGSISVDWKGNGKDLCVTGIHD